MLFIINIIQSTYRIANNVHSIDFECVTMREIFNIEIVARIPRRMRSNRSATEYAKL